MSAKGPNPLRVAVTVIRSLLKRRPRPAGGGAPPDTHDLSAVLEKLRNSGVGGLASVRHEIEAFLASSGAVDPDRLDRDEALAFWLNLYNAGVLDLAARAAESAVGSVLRVPGGFSKPFVEVSGERLSLSDVENGKIRRFKDPRIHGALVCGSASCPTLRYEPYTGATIDDQLDDQLRSFFAGGGVAVTGSPDTTVLLSRVLLGTATTS